MVFSFGVFTPSLHSKKLITFSEGVVKLFKIAFLFHLAHIFGQKDTLLSNTSLKILGFSSQWRLSHRKCIDITFSFLYFDSLFCFTPISFPKTPFLEAGSFIHLLPLDSKK